MKKQFQFQFEFEEHQPNQITFNYSSGADEKLDTVVQDGVPLL